MASFSFLFSVLSVLSVFQVLNWSPVAQGKYTMLDGAGANVRYDAQIPFTFLPAYDTYPIPLTSYVDPQRKLDTRPCMCLFRATRQTQ